MENHMLFFGAILIFLVLSNLAVYLFIKRGTWRATEQLRNGIIGSLPALFAFAAVMIFQSSSSIVPPSHGQNVERVDSIGSAERRINSLELHAKQLETYLKYERERQLILVVGLSAIFAMPLVLIGLALYRPKESKSEVYYE